MLTKIEVAALFILLILCIQIRMIAPGPLLLDTAVALMVVALYINVKTNARMSLTLNMLGKHSFNIFLFHTFIYYLYFERLIYITRNPVIIWLTLLTVSIVISIAIERLKKYIKFSTISSNIENHLCPKP